MDYNKIQPRFRKYCLSCKVSSKQLKYFKFPVDHKRRQEWFKALEVGNNSKEYIYVCSKHFIPSDFKPGCGRSRLRIEAVPAMINKSGAVNEQTAEQINGETNNSILNFNHSSETCLQSEIIIPDLLSIEDNEIDMSNMISDQTETEPNSSDLHIDERTLEHDYAKKIIEPFTKKCTTCIDFIVKNKSLKEKNKRKERSLSKLRKENCKLFVAVHSYRKQHISHAMFEFDDASVKFYTGLTSYTMFRTIFKYFLPFGVRKDKFRRRRATLSPEDQFFAFLIKMRTNFDLKHIAFLFNISVPTLSRIFNYWLRLAYVKLRKSNIWPNRNVLLENAPKNFKEKYPKVIASVDCVQLHLKSISFKKSDTVLKGLIVVDPKGGIIFLSELYQDKLSEKEVICKSGFIDTIKNKLLTDDIYPRDEIIANKVFNISSKLEPVKFYYPEINEDGKDSSRECIDKVIHRIKQFKIIDNLKISQYNTIDQIWAVCVLLCNFMVPGETKKNTI